MLKLIVLLFLVVMVIDCRGQESEAKDTDYHYDGRDDDDEEMTEPRSRRSLCVNKSGCVCNGKTETADCHCLKNKEKMSFVNVLVPEVLKKLTIHNCSTVDLNNHQFFQTNLTELSISFVGSLYIGPATLKRVDHLELKHIDQLSLDPEAFDQLEANSIHLDAINFTSTSRFTPHQVQQDLIIKDSVLSEDLLISVNRSKDLQVQFSGCRFNKLSLELDVAGFHMKDNTFMQFSSPASLAIRYSTSLTLLNNSYGAHEMLPDVQCGPTARLSSSRPLDDGRTVNAKDAERWWKTFDIHEIRSAEFRGKIPTGASDCPDLNKLDDFFSGRTSTSTPTRRPITNPDKDGKAHVTSHFNSGATSEYRHHFCRHFFFAISPATVIALFSVLFINWIH